MELPAAAEDAVRSPVATTAAAAAALISFPGGPGDLELALEEELALLAAGERPSDPGEHSQAEPGPLAEGAGPQSPPIQDPELLSVIRQKEKDLVLAARLGKALLERNQDMSRQYEQMHKELTDKLEVRTSFPGWVGSRGQPRHIPLSLGSWGITASPSSSVLTLPRRRSSGMRGRMESC
jgi:coiled-coil domain-containing protein 64